MKAGCVWLHFSLTPCQSAPQYLLGNLGFPQTPFKQEYSKGMELSSDSYNVQCGLMVISYRLRFIKIKSCQTNLIPHFDSILQGNIVGTLNWYLRNAFYKAF